MNPQPEHRAHARWLWLVPLALFASAFTSARADVRTRITAINSVFSLTHDATLTVQPGDTVSLTADQVDVDYYGNTTHLDRYNEDFLWSTDSGSSDVCDPNYDCSPTNFETHSYGVNYYVPYSMGAQIVLTVQNRIDGTYDQLVLVNGSYGGTGYVPPSGSYSDPDDYPNEEFDYNRGLAGHGRWVYISGERCFVPYSYQTDWQPYQHGYWYWSEHGWTWHSYDPWGWITEHYGYWRNHSVYGWVWFAFPERQWRPAVVTWFHTDHGIGWYPYWSSYAHGYRHGYDHGYRDGYWDGYNAGRYDTYRWGGTYVLYGNFLVANIFGVRVTHVHTYYGDAYATGRYGVVLRDHRYAHPRAFVEARLGRAVPVTPVTVVTRRHAGGGEVRWVRPSHRTEVPPQYRDAYRHANDRVRSGNHRVPVGSVVNRDGRVTRPSAPVVVTPRVPDRNGGYRPMPPRSRLPDSAPRPTPPSRERPTYPAPAPRNPDRGHPAPAPAPRNPDRGYPDRGHPAPAPAPRNPDRGYPAPAPAPRNPDRGHPAPAPAPRNPDRGHPAPGRTPGGERPRTPTPAPRDPGRANPGHPAPSKPAPGPHKPSRPGGHRPR